MDLGTIALGHKLRREAISNTNPSQASRLCYMDQSELVRQHLSTVHPDYVAKFDQLVQRAKDQEDE